MLNKLQLTLILLLMIARSSAQSVEVKGGSSSLYSGYGGQTDIYLGHQTINLSGAVQNGLIQFGVTDKFDYRKFRIQLGDSAFNYSVDGSGLGVQVRGLNIQRGNLTVFSGQVGVQTILPYYSTFRPHSYGTGLFYCKRHHKLEFRHLSVYAGGQKTFLSSLKYLGKYFQGSGSVGLYQNRFQYTGIGILNVSHIQLAVNRTQQTYQTTPLTTNSASGAFHVERFSVSGAITHLTYGASHITGVTGSSSVRPTDWLSVGYSYYHSSGQTLHQVNVTETTRRVVLQASIDNQKHLSGNVTVNTHVLTVSLGRTEMLLPQHGWVSSTTVSVAVKIKDFMIRLDRLLLPNATHKLTVNGSDWIYNDKISESEPKFAKYVIEGTVRDELGNPVAGVPVRVGKIICFSDRDGKFYLRVKHRKPYEISVDVEGFMMSGKIKVIRSENLATPGQALNIVVQKL